MDKKDSIIICIGTIGSPTFNKCYKIVNKLYNKDPRVKDIAVIRDKAPQSAWLNAMRTASVGSKWCLQIDEDMYLYKDALDELLSFAEKKEKSGIKILNASSLLFDLFLQTNVGSLKLWSSEALSALEFRDILGGDRDFTKRAKALGYSNVEMKMVLGEHDSAPNPKIAFSKYFEYTQKLRKFSGESSAVNFNKFLLTKYKRNKTLINKKAYDGSRSGLSSKLKDRTKGK